jgi:hypothetical protein
MTTLDSNPARPSITNFILIVITELPFVNRYL